MNSKNILKYLATAALVLNLNATETYTVDELIVQALENSPDLDISKSNFEASKSRYDSAYGGYLPKVDFHGALGKAGANDMSAASNDMIDYDVLLGKLSLKQIVYDFGKTGGSVDTFKYQTSSFEQKNIQDISDKIASVKLAYYNVLKAISLIIVQKENVKLNKAQLYRAQKYFTAGIRTKIDVSDAQVSLIQAKLELRQAQYDLKLTYAKLDSTIGLTALENDYSVYAKELDLNNLFSSLGAYPLDLKESILYAYENRAELKDKKVQIDVATAQKREASSDYYPSFYFLGDYTRQEVDTKLQQFTPQNQWQATLNLDWNIYEGGTTSAHTQEQEINLNISNAALINAKLLAKQDITYAYINVNRNRDSVELSQSLLSVSDEKFDQASKRYKHGLSDYIELQQARQGYIDAKSTLVVNYYDYYRTVAELDNKIGK